MPVKMFSFVGGEFGEWKILKIENIIGLQIPTAKCLDIKNENVENTSNKFNWVFKGVTSNLRYTNQDEKDILASKQPSLNRVEATLGAMILIKKSEIWWEMSQDERRKIFELQSEHIKIGIKYLPAVARRLHHSRDLFEPFDFITWFEFSPESENEFNQMVNELRKTKEWNYVEREVDIRVKRGN